MKRQRIIILLLVIVLSLTGCSHEEVKIVSGGAALFDKVEIQNFEEAKPEARERHIYNKNDEQKNRFLQFLNDEIPLVDYDVDNYPPETVYASEIFLDVHERNCMPNMYYVLDMDGDGEDEFCFYSWLILNIIKYDHKREVFTLWKYDDWRYKPLREGEMYAAYNGEHVPPTREWIYKSYDREGNTLELNIYSMILTGEDTREYEIWENTGNNMDALIEVVSEEEWLERRAYLIDLIEDAPEWITYEDLLE